MNNLELCFLFDYWICPDEIADSASALIVTRDANMGLPRYYETIRFGPSPFHEPARHSATHYVSEDEASYAIDVPLFKRIKVYEVEGRFYVKLADLMGDSSKDENLVKRFLRWAVVTKNGFVEVDDDSCMGEPLYNVTINSSRCDDALKEDLDITNAVVTEKDVHTRRYNKLSSRHDSETQLYEIWCTIKDTIRNIFSESDCDEGGMYITGFLCWLRNTFFSTKEKKGWVRFDRNINLYQIPIWCDPNFGNGAYFEVKYEDPNDIHSNPVAFRVSKGGEWIGWEEIIELSQKYVYGLVWDLTRKDFCVKTYVP